MVVVEMGTAGQGREGMVVYGNGDDGGGSGLMYLYNPFALHNIGDRIVLGMVMVAVKIVGYIYILIHIYRSLYMLMLIHATVCVNACMCICTQTHYTYTHINKYECSYKNTHIDEGRQEGRQEEGGRNVPETGRRQAGRKEDRRAGRKEGMY